MKRISQGSFKSREKRSKINDNNKTRKQISKTRRPLLERRLGKSSVKAMRKRAVEIESQNI